MPLNKKFSIVSLVMLLAFSLVAPVAYAANISTVDYAPSGAVVGTFVAASTIVTTFTLSSGTHTALAAGNEVVLTFPDGTTLANIVAGDFTIQQAASGTSLAGAATAPSNIAFDDAANTITLTVDANSLSNGGDSDGFGEVTISTSGTAGGDEIRHPTTATTTATFTAATPADSGSQTDVTFVAAEATKVLFVQQPSNTVYGSAISPAVTVRVTDEFNNTRLTDNATEITLAIQVNPPGDATLGGTVTQTVASGVATFNDLTISKIGEGYVLRATSTDLTLADSNEFDITAKELTIGGTFTAENKTYDGTTEATIDDNSLTLATVEDGDTVTLTPVLVFDNKNVGTDKTVSLTGSSLSGDDSGNYTLSLSGAPTTTADISALALTGSITASNKGYDGSTTATIASRTLSGVIGSDDVSYTGGTATFDSSGCGTGKSVTATGLSLTGADSDNYTVNTTAETTADVTGCNSGFVQGTFNKPEGPFAIAVNGGADITKARNVTLSLQAGSNVESMTISSHQADLSDAALVDYEPVTTWDLCSKLGGLIKFTENECPEGPYTVYIRFYTGSGQSSEIFSDTIEYRKSGVSTYPSTAMFSRTLRRGSTGDDVKLLQQLLNSHGIRVATSGAGSLGNETNYFGSLTERAVQKFQAQYGIISSGAPETTGYGLVNSQTLEKLNEVFGGVKLRTESTMTQSITGGFSRTLRYGSTGGDIKKLQQFLNLDPDTRLAESGAGSPGNETEYFGSITENAVQKFQTKYNIVSSGTPQTTGYGLVGPKTRAKLNDLLSQ